MIQDEPKYEKTIVESDTDVEGGKPMKIEQAGLDVKIGQLEVAVGSLKEKVGGDFAQLSQKVDSSLELRRWFIIALVTIFGIIVALVVGASNMMINNLNSQREIQKDYYQLLLQDKNDINNLEIGLKLKEACFQKNSYWEYKNCLLSR